MVIESAASAVIAFAFRTCLTVEMVGNVSGTQIESTTTMASHTYTAPMLLNASPRARRDAADGLAGASRPMGLVASSGGAGSTSALVSIVRTLVTACLPLWRSQVCVQ